MARDLARNSYGCCFLLMENGTGSSASGAASSSITFENGAIVTNLEPKAGTGFIPPGAPKSWERAGLVENGAKITNLEPLSLFLHVDSLMERHVREQLGPPGDPPMTPLGSKWRRFVPKWTWFDAKWSPK